jgi:hypothetical protein
MDFSQFLVNNPEIPTIKEIKGKIKEPEKDANKEKEKVKPVKKEKEPKIKKEKIVDLKSVFKNPEQLEKPNKVINDDTPEINFKRGDFVKIIRLEGSPLNVYKGYYGEIKEYIYRSDSAYIVLEAMAYPRRIKFPLGHFKHRYS